MTVTVFGYLILISIEFYEDCFGPQLQLSSRCLEICLNPFLLNPADVFEVLNIRKYIRMLLTVSPGRRGRGKGGHFRKFQIECVPFRVLNPDPI